MDDIKIVALLNLIVAALQFARELIGLARDLKKDKKNDNNQNGGE